MATVIRPPVLDDPGSVDAARKRLARSRHRVFSWLGGGRKQPQQEQQPPGTHSLQSMDAQEEHSEDVTTTEGHLASSPPSGHIGAVGATNDEGTWDVIDLCDPPPQSTLHDEFRWAVVYENQRGVFLFSTPYFSRLSLFPTDPPPFTILSVSPVKRSEQPPITLESYPLPSGQWKWVSKQWLIDMRSEGGEVQHDGFEYNWRFQQHHWRSEVGKLGAGGFVRRRRWIRLMVLPASSSSSSPSGQERAWTGSDAGHSGQEGKAERRRSMHSAKSLPSAVSLDAHEVWVEGDAEGSWKRYLRILPTLHSDGHRLEAWCSWMGLPSKYILHHQPVQWSEDGNGSTISEAAIQTLRRAVPPSKTVLEVLSQHYEEIINSFIYPQSRADFLNILVLTGAAGQLDEGVQDAVTRSVDFWSYTKQEDLP